MKITVKERGIHRRGVSAALLVVALMSLAVALRQDVGPHPAKIEEGPGAPANLDPNVGSNLSNNMGRLNAPAPGTRQQFRLSLAPEELWRVRLAAGTIIAHSSETRHPAGKSAFPYPTVAPSSSPGGDSPVWPGGVTGYILEEVPVEPPITVEACTYSKVWRLMLIGNNFITGLIHGNSERHHPVHVWIDGTYVGAARAENENYQSLIITDYTLLREGARLAFAMSWDGGMSTPGQPDQYFDEPLHLLKPVSP